MKYTRSTTRLVVIVAVLALALFLSGCAPASGGRVPWFLEVGAQYEAAGSDGHISFKVLDIRGDGWILAEMRGEQAPGWINTAHLYWVMRARR